MEFKSYLNQFIEVLNNTICTNSNGESLKIDEGFTNSIDAILDCKSNNSTIYLVGNGGSSGIVSHAAIDFLNACKIKAHPLTDNSLLTCMANDYGYENVFAEPLRKLISPQDILIAVSSSGNSMNIINACKVARDSNAKVITFSGFKSDNKLRTEGHFNFWVDDSHYGRVEIGHSLLLHYISDYINK